MLTRRLVNEKQKLNEKLRLSKKEILEQIRYIEREREELLEQKYEALCEEQVEIGRNTERKAPNII